MKIIKYSNPIAILFVAQKKKDAITFLLLHEVMTQGPLCLLGLRINNKISLLAITSCLLYAKYIRHYTQERNKSSSISGGSRGYGKVHRRHACVIIV